MDDLKAKIMILEDEPIIALHLEKVIKKFGHEVVGICDSGLNALAMFDKEMPNLVFVDIVLNGEMSGIDFVRTIKEKHEVSVIYLTSHTDQEIVRTARETLPNAFLKKPFYEPELKTTIEMSLLGQLEKVSTVTQLKKQNHYQEMNIRELMDTNAHLVTATWRERELKAELQKSKEIIEKQNQNILASINYARRIQQCIIPGKEQLNELLGEHFMFYQSKEVVSGDFPWLYDYENYVYIAAIDCTGHGVPGAMMSLIGYLLLNNIMNDPTQKKTPSQVLNELHHAVVTTLKQNDPENKAADGMDVALCRISKDHKEVMYSGAHRPLYHISEGVLNEYKGCRYPIGGMQHKGENFFKDHVVYPQKNDSIYFFSDGLTDQFGGEENMKLGPKRIREALEDNAHCSMEKMKSVFYNLFHDWKGEQKQMDDVLMIGIKF